MVTADQPWVLRVPDFIDAHVAASGPLRDDESRMALAIALSRENTQRGGSPFGAVVMRGETVVAAGVNCVLSSGLSIAHAEIVAMLRAQQAQHAQVQAADGAQNEPLALYSSTEPCCQCYGALFWAGVQRLVCGATTSDAEQIGFDEGPKPERWVWELERRGTSVVLGILRADASAVLQEYARRGGPIYGARILT